MTRLTIIGGGLAGCEAAWQAAARGVPVDLYEMRPHVMTGAHTGGGLAELVCSNSLGSNLLDRASGLLKEELRWMGSLLVRCAEQTALPAGGALAVDREGFSCAVSQSIESHPLIRVIREELPAIPAGPTILASGPLTSPNLSHAIQQLTGQDALYFFDAIAPVVTFESINMDVAFRASRYGKGEQGEGDYINCPFTREQYDAFVIALREAEQIALRTFEQEIPTGVRAGSATFFESCLPAEVIARRGDLALAYGPMRPIGLTNPHSGRRPYAVLQLRQDNLAGSLYNLVGFQTNLTFPEQKRVFGMVPGLEIAEFARYGQMHRNTFINAPLLLDPTLQFRTRSDLFVAGQISGVEGYMGNIATGLLAGMNAARILTGRSPITLPDVTILGALCKYISQADPTQFQPMKANFGLMPPLDLPVRGKRNRGAAYSQRALAELQRFLPSMEES